MDNTLLNIVDERKVAYWKSVNDQRVNFEPKMTILVRKTLDKQFADLADRIDSTNINSDVIINTIDEEPIYKLFVVMYTAVGVFFARQERRKQKSQVITFVKEDPDEDKYIQWLQNYIKNKLGLRITSITGESRKQALKIIREVVAQSVLEGWSADQTATAIRKNLNNVTVMNQWRALRIARTEVMTASNVGSMIGAQDFAKESGLRMQKYWIATYDNRTRETHLTVEGQNPKDLDEGFRVGAYLMECPGDPDAGPEEVINCRCTIAFKAVI